MILLFTNTEAICGTIVAGLVLFFWLCVLESFPTINIHKHYYDKDGKEIKK